MRKGLIRKGLVLSIILLVIGVGIQPVLADTSIITLKNVDEDCIECQVSEGYSLLKIKLLFFKINVITNLILLSKFGKIPEIKDKCYEILDIIDYKAPLYSEVICIIILANLITIYGIYTLLGEIWEKLNELNPYLAYIFHTIAILPVIGMIGVVYSTGMLFDCWGPPGPS